MRAILELALEYGNQPIQIKVIADRQDISNKYLEQLMAILKTSGLVRSVRGPRGGYLLAKPPNEVKLSHVFTTLEGPLLTVECVDHPEYCPKCTECVTRQVWAKMQNAILEVLESMTLQDLVDKSRRGEDYGSYQI